MDLLPMLGEDACNGSRTCKPVVSEIQKLGHAEDVRAACSILEVPLRVVRAHPYLSSQLLCSSHLPNSNFLYTRPVRQAPLWQHQQGLVAVCHRRRIVPCLAA